MARAACFGGGGEDIRDPKLAAAGDRLVLYALRSRGFDPMPYQTVVTWSADGRAWAPWAAAAPAGWLLGRPKVAADGAWYAPAHHLGEAAVKLFTSADGLAWEERAEITRGAGADETAVEPLPDGRLLAVTRLEGGPGVAGKSAAGPAAVPAGALSGSLEAGTLISVAEAPYTDWVVLARSRVTRLDGPALFTHGGSVFAVGRRQPRVSGPWWWSGSALARKRTALFAVRGGERGPEGAQGRTGEPGRDDGLGRGGDRGGPAELVHLADLPSAGDTGYPGVVTRDGRAFISYYSSPRQLDVAWLAAMLLPTAVRLASVPLDALPSD